MTDIVSFVIFLVVTLIWGIVGLLLWIPILLRATAVFSVMIVYSAVTNQKPTALKSLLDNSTAFYPGGFKLINDTFNGSQSEAKFRANEWPTVFMETVIAALFWGLVWWLIDSKSSANFMSLVWSWGESVFLIVNMWLHAFS